ncbi:MAG: hypothetical protein WAN86_05800 [Hyphomicrobiaceae bacterium]
MSAKERDRAHAIRQVSDRRLRQERAAELLGIGCGRLSGWWLRTVVEGTVAWYLGGVASLRTIGWR